jgi:hypothetical protein
MEDYACRLKLEEERLCVIEGNGCCEQMFSVPQLRADCRFVQISEIHPGSVSEYLSVEGWLTIGECD